MNRDRLVMGLAIALSPLLFGGIADIALGVGAASLLALVAVPVGLVVVRSAVPPPAA